MLSAQLITIGTEITSGEVINSNASWLSLQLEEMGVRVFSHLSVRDQQDEIQSALKYAKHPLVIVTGGLGPTSDDITREAMAVFTGVPLDFDNKVWDDLKKMYAERGLPLREAHRWQCHFPRGATRLPNGAGTALGFAQEFEGRKYFVLPGPPTELQVMWSAHVQPAVAALIGPVEKEWVRWTCLGAPESEVAEKVEAVIAGQEIEVGYRAQVPYVKVKVFVGAAQKLLADKVERALGEWVVARGTSDIAEELLREWSLPSLEIADSFTGTHLFGRIMAADALLEKAQAKRPTIHFKSTGRLEGSGIEIRAEADEFIVSIVRPGFARQDFRKQLPYKLPLNSERGRRSAAEWGIWIALCALRARESQA